MVQLFKQRTIVGKNLVQMQELTYLIVRQIDHVFASVPVST